MEGRGQTEEPKPPPRSRAMGINTPIRNPCALEYIHQVADQPGLRLSTLYLDNPVANQHHHIGQRQKGKEL
jgi:hypothetical protein